MTATETGVETQGPADLMAPGLKPMARLKAILGGSAGNLVEWYDWFAYSSLALYFAPHFFPKGDATAQLMQAAAVFAVGFMARPVGAWIMGLYADRAGRRAALSVSVGMMCLGSLIIAATPDYGTIGVAAPIVLVTARLLQGLSVGGEYGASATYMAEMGGRKHRGFWSSFQFVTLVMGQLTALGVLILLQKTLSPEALADWGWRVPFLIGGLLAVIVFWIRSRLEESASYLAAKQAGMPRAKTMMLFLHYPKETAAIFLMTAGGSAAFYAYTTYMQKFLVGTSGFSKDTATMITAAALGLYVVVLPVMGWISDRLSRKLTLGFAFGVGALITYPVMSAIAGTSDPTLAFILVALLVTVLSGYNSVSAVVKAELFPAHVRALGVALPYGLATATFGGTAEYIALWFKGRGMESGFYIYVSAIMTVSFIVAMMLRNTKTTSLILED